MNTRSEPLGRHSPQAAVAGDLNAGRRSWRSAALALPGLAAGAPGSAWAQERGADWGWGMHPMSWMWGAWGLGMMVMMVVFWGLVTAGIVLAIRWLAGQGERSRSDRALDILRERYARGEIDKDEFEAKQRDLR
ncbi:MAG TPA: SHOCT domain-containing protein [Methylomirabilota bacterium]|nr:SHOCT domain-containing protein [Methylomirabilota bacterium]